MHTLKIVLAASLIHAPLSAQTQTAPAASSTRPAKPVPKTHKQSQEQILLEQINDRFQKLEELNHKIEELQQKYNNLEKRVAVRDAQLEQATKDATAAQVDAADAQRKLDETQHAIGPNGAAVNQLQAAVADLRSTSATLSMRLETTETTTKKLEAPESIRFKGVTLTPGGFMAAETVDRQRAIGGDVNTQFSGMPFTGQTAATFSEFNASARQSRVSLVAEGRAPAGVLRSYVEADFLSAGTTSNDNESNSYTLRLRQAWGQVALNDRWTLTGGQMWSLATEYKHGLENNAENIPLTIDAQYNVGFAWERQYGFRMVKQVGQHLWFGGAVEESQTLNVGGHNLPTLLYQQAGNSGGLYNPTANYSYNYAPDLLAKAAYETDWGHFELFGVGRFYRDRIYPNGPAPAGASQPATTSAQGAFTSKAAGGGIGANARVLLLSKKLEIGAHGLFGDGIGRYGTTQLPDATARPDGSLALLTGGSALGSAVWHATDRFDMYAYYGGEYAKRAWYASQYISTTAGPTLGQPILVGYGAPTNVVSGCHVEVLPVTSPNGGGDVPGSASNCNADTRNFQEGTAGYWFRFYRGSHGTLQQGIQYSYAERRTWQGIGNPAAGLTNSPKAIDNMWFTSFRYYLPQ
jgi:peptidoglycan hydrolase CwlO-like protein